MLFEQAKAFHADEKRFSDVCQKVFSKRVSNKRKSAAREKEAPGGAAALEKRKAEERKNLHRRKALFQIGKDVVDVLRADG